MGPGPLEMSSGKYTILYNIVYSTLCILILSVNLVTCLFQLLQFCNFEHSIYKNIQCISSSDIKPFYNYNYAKFIVCFPVPMTTDHAPFSVLYSLASKL